VAKLLSDAKHRKIELEYNRLENTFKICIGELMQLNKVIRNCYNCESSDIHLAQLLSDSRQRKSE